MIMEFLRSIDILVKEVVSTPVVVYLWNLILEMPIYAELIEFIQDLLAIDPVVPKIVMVNILFNSIRRTFRGFRRFGRWIVERYRRNRVNRVSRSATIEVIKPIPNPEEKTPENQENLIKKDIA